MSGRYCVARNTGSYMYRKWTDLSLSPRWDGDEVVWWDYRLKWHLQLEGTHTRWGASPSSSSLEGSGQGARVWSWIGRSTGEAACWTGSLAPYAHRQGRTVGRVLKRKKDELNTSKKLTSALTLVIVTKNHLHGNAHLLFQGSQHRLNVVFVEDGLPLFPGISSTKCLCNSNGSTYRMARK